MDWPWLPVEEAARPAGLSRSWRAATRLTPPRTLKAPTGWRFSHLTYASHPSARPSAAARRHGVGSRYGAMRRRARRTSWMVGSQSGAPSPVICALMSARGLPSTYLYYTARHVHGGRVRQRGRPAVNILVVGLRSRAPRALLH